MRRTRMSLHCAFSLAAALLLFAAFTPARAQVPVEWFKRLERQNSDLPFQSEEALPAPSRGHGSVVARGRLYVIGVPVSNPQAPEAARREAARRADGEIYSSEIAPGGVLYPWRAEAPPDAAVFSRPLTAACAVWREEWILFPVAAPGEEPGAAAGATRLAAARLDADGRVARWAYSAPWPGPPLREMALAASDSAVFVIGGAAPDGALSAAVFRAPLRLAVDASGAENPFGEWETPPALPEPRAGAAAACDSRQVFLLGGRLGAAEPASGLLTREVWSLPLDAPPAAAAADAPSTAPLVTWSRRHLRMSEAVEGAVAAAQGERLYLFGALPEAASRGVLAQFARLRVGKPEAWSALRLGLPPLEGVAFAISPDGAWLFLTGGGTRKGAGAPGPSDHAVWSVSLLPPAPGSPETQRVHVPFEPQIAGPALAPGALDHMRLTPPARFVSDAEAFEHSRRLGCPVFMFVYSSADPECVALREKLLSRRPFIELMAGVALGEVDLDARPAARQTYRAETVPLFLLFDASGEEVGRDTAARTLPEFAQFSFKIR